MCVELEVRNTKMCLLLTYWDVREDERNEIIVTSIRSWIDEYKRKLLGIEDMNAHVGILGEQSVNRNGERLLRLMDECGLIMINADPK